ncbi:MAG: CmpA/NrtA family ABC transporter substrate-binding protein [Luteolibacter sp.]|uniref:CmpA/NrtA family ABC transporter substrate-binding protein n=1 Tax=Luteolibacter sp. TaxID=1962973 RepID=UPI00326655CE
MVLPKSFPNTKALRFGYVPLVDCAPIAVALETGIFDRHGLNVALSRELGWASVRDKIIYGHLDAAQSIAGIALALGLGINEMRCEVAVPMILNLHGNAITLSTQIGMDKIGRGEGLRGFLTHCWKKERPFTLAVTHRYSSHFTLLKTWLARHGVISPEHVEIIFLPPSLMPRQLKAGHIDGFCVGEPWNSESIISGTGWCPVTSAEIARGHPEKILLLSGNFLREEKEKSIMLVAALIEACQLCQSPEFREDLISILALKAYTGASPEVLRNSLGPIFNNGVDRVSASGFHVFHGDSMNRPSMDKASWVLSELRNVGTIPEGTCGSLSRIFREDLYHAAEQSMSSAGSKISV